jgi:hypothetical protein
MSDDQADVLAAVDDVSFSLLVVVVAGVAFEDRERERDRDARLAELSRLLRDVEVVDGATRLPPPAIAGACVCGQM